jgi:hypothetical protein
MATFRFMDLPAELRDEVYTYLMLPEDNCIVDDDGIITKYLYDLSFYRTSKQIHEEAKRVFRVLPWNTFARIETPWDEAQQHVSMEGMVPILASGNAAENFNHIHVRIIIDAPSHTREVNKKFIVFLNDLDKFTKMWMYSDLSYSGDLNRHLRLRLLLRNPSVPAGDEYIKMTKALQRKILLPFGLVKNLDDVKVISQDAGVIIDKDIENEMRRLMDVEYESAESCLDKTKKFMDEGDQLTEGVAGDADGKGHVAPNYLAAIEKYIEAFASMHIVCVNRRRSIWGDAWFDRFLESGRYVGRHGQIVRLTLRVELVSAVTNCYYQLGISSQPPDDFKYLVEAHFWGYRTIKLMRQHVTPNDIPHDNFPNEAMRAMGRCYLRTGMAGMELAKHVPLQLDSEGITGGLSDQSMKQESKRMLMAARRWCPNDDEVESGLWRFGLS